MTLTLALALPLTITLTLALTGTRTRTRTLALTLTRTQTPHQVRKPARVLGLGGARNNVLILAAGVKHMLAVTEEGKMYSWGDGSCGRHYLLWQHLLRHHLLWHYLLWQHLLWHHSLWLVRQARPHGYLVITCYLPSDDLPPTLVTTPHQARPR